MKIYGDIKSGNCYKIKLLTSFLDTPHEWVALDIMKGETRTQEFLQKTSSGKIPLLELEDGRCLSESNAILNYLAHGSDFLPQDPFTLAKVQQWQFFEQYSHEPYIAVARYINVYLGMPEYRKNEYENLQEGGNKALSIMEQRLQQTPFLAGGKISTADISLYGYTHVADEGGFDLNKYSAIQAWVKRVQATPGYTGMN
ncbi:glutathione S-transferase family protein [Parendozoicomonas sp. Alg238-R29]|uniref:glutathione S-transferase family protein n=1 Tax=Parendozoicomonas sp. Alg238-R29 TaxID=2993446 RepID=UPI00248E9FBF|nr:glutathione S-transferase family protein [Parendozoicomonas sp. Alg238-R29]